MQLLRVTVSPHKDGKATIRLQGRDDAGHLIEKWVVSPNNSSTAGVIEAAYRSLITKAAEGTEEEGYQGKAK